MDQERSEIGLQEICEGCLSLDRKLKVVREEESEKFFKEIIAPLELISYPLSLCWECTAVIQRVARFKTQVKRAHQLLMSYLLHHSTNLPTQSKLKTTNLNSLEIINYNSEETNFQINTIKNNQIKLKNSNEFENEQFKSNLREDVSDTNNFFITSTDLTNKIDNVTHETNHKTFKIKNIDKSLNIRDNTIDVSPEIINFKSNNTDVIDKTDVIDVINDINSDKTSVNSKIELNNDEVQPLAFIKMEDDNDFDNLEGYFVDENDDGNGDRDQDLKAVLKSSKLKNPSKKKKSKLKKKQQVEFDDSDDEPLTLKKSKRDMSKENKTATKEDGRKNPRARKEKPAGVVRNARVTNKLLKLGVSTDRVEMVVLSWEEVEQERQRILQSSSFTRHTHRCTDCAIGFNHSTKLATHMLKHDQSAGAVECNVCKIRCRDSHALSAHKRRHRLRWRCVECSALWSRAAIAADHLAREHGNRTAVHVCNICQEQYDTLGKLRSHLKSHSERQKCELCGKTFRDRCSLRTHLFIHKGEKEHVCPHCGKQFLFKKAMELHIVTHAAPQHLYCHQCDVTFKNRMSFYQHMKYNLKHIDQAKLKHACNVCDKKFLKAARLEEHTRAVHLKITPIRCTTPGCAFACASRPVLRTHIRMVHRDARRTRNHVCHHCGKAYTTKKTLEGHLRTHTGERPLHCSLCPATFRYEAALYNHNKLVHLKPKQSGRGRQPTVVPPATESTAPPWETSDAQQPTET